MGNCKAVQTNMIYVCRNKCKQMRGSHRKYVDLKSQFREFGSSSLHQLLAIPATSRAATPPAVSLKHCQY